MQIIKKHKEVMEVDVTDEVYDICDKCGQKIEVNGYDAFSCEFERKIGQSFPESANIEIDELELCQECAEDCINLLRENGYNIISRDWNW